MSGCKRQRVVHGGEQLLWPEELVAIAEGRLHLTGVGDWVIVTEPGCEAGAHEAALFGTQFHLELLGDDRARIQGWSEDLSCGCSLVVVRLSELALEP